MAKPSQLGLFDAPAPSRPSPAQPGLREGWSSPLCPAGPCSICGSWRQGQRVHTSLTNATAHEECSDKVCEILRGMLASGRIREWPCTPRALRAIVGE